MRWWMQSAGMMKARNGMAVLCLIPFWMFCTSGCATPKTTTITRIEYAVPSGQIVQPCQDVELEFHTNGEMLMSLLELHTQYKICAARMDAVIRYFENIQMLNEAEP